MSVFPSALGNPGSLECVQVGVTFLLVLSYSGFLLASDL